MFYVLYLFDKAKISSITGGVMDNFLELLLNRRSIRKYEERQIERDKIDIILKSALLSPSSRSRRPWEFIVVSDKEMLRKLSLCREHSSDFLSGASAGIVVLANPKVCDVWIEDASIAAIIIQIAAQSLGLGSCWIQIRDRVHDENTSAGDYVKKLLNIPQYYEVECIIAVGYPAEYKLPYNEKDLRYDKVHNEKYNGG